MLGRDELALTYETTWQVRAVDPYTPPAEGREAASFGKLWFSSFHRRVRGLGSAVGLTAFRGDGRRVSFRSTGTSKYASDTETSDRLRLASVGYHYIDALRRTIETYQTSTGALQRLDYAAGGGLTFTQSTEDTPAEIAPGPGYVIEVRDAFGRNVRFEYQTVNAAARVSTIVDPAGQRVHARYDDTGNLAAIDWPDGSSRSFLYERIDLPWALTGVVDESSKRYSWFEYDTDGRAIATRKAGEVDSYSVRYATPPSLVVADTYLASFKRYKREYSWRAPSGVVLTTPSGDRHLETELVAGTPRITRRSQPAGAGCEASTSEARYDVQGNVVSRDDFNGTRACYGHDLSRNLETVRVEGLSNTAACGTYTAPAAALPSEARKVSTQWHPDWSLPTRVAGPRRVVTTVYNGQPDPFASSASASCAPADAKLPDGKPIAVVCKRVEQATTDTDGSKGFSATLPTGVAAQQWSYTYNQYGQVLTEDGPRTDVADVTRYDYYLDTTADWTKGDLKQVTNPAGQVTRFTKYNPHGHALQHIDANGVVTSYTYDLRQRLKTMTVGTELTQYDYHPTGLLQRVTQPNTSYIEYLYDDAHRLTGLKDGLGNSVTYTLDNAGNRTKEEIKDPNGVLMRNMTRAYDALGRLKTATGTLQ
ncbi:hypothetical protein OOT46_30280 [Aquabacterium sp. A7-Y]|uniref:hypothetical protein n=1 Tax=Aquabacterium sp. A7-Y TaxID=1349605 RepID=UPI00223E7C3B|nr:hypothetical protein [Aquabacterium sp. A7-Y]MCW7542086.1 hypothetical protein [Aquabacterium sp. A7-Y]